MCIRDSSLSKAFSPYLLIPGNESMLSIPSKSSFTKIGCIKSFTDKLFSATKLLIDEVDLARLNLDWGNFRDTFILIEKRGDHYTLGKRGILFYLASYGFIPAIKI